MIKEITDNMMIKYAIELMIKDNKLDWLDAIEQSKENYEMFFDKIIDRIYDDKICDNNNTINMIAENIYNKIN